MHTCPLRVPRITVAYPFHNTPLPTPHLRFTQCLTSLCLIIPTFPSITHHPHAPFRYPPTYFPSSLSSFFLSLSQTLTFSFPFPSPVCSLPSLPLALITLHAATPAEHKHFSLVSQAQVKCLGSPDNLTKPSPGATFRKPRNLHTHTCGGYCGP